MRVLLIALGGIVALLVVAVAAAVLLVDADILKPRLVAEVKRATGRDIVIAGHLRLEPSFPPSVSIENVSIANMPGGSRPQMATIRRVEAQLNPMALLSRRVVIERLVLLQPDILLETTAQGEPNWHFGRTAVAGDTGSGPGTPTPARQVNIQTIHVRDGVVTWREGRSQRAIHLEMQRLDGTSPAADATVSLTGEGRVDGSPFTLTAQTGPLSRLLDRAARTPWPVQAILLNGTAPAFGTAPPTGNGARLAINGTITDPAAGRGYELTVEASVADLSALATTDMKLPPLKRLALSGRIADSGDGLPEFSQIKLQAGTSDLSSQVPGLIVDGLELSIPGMAEPMHGEVHGTLSGTPLDVVGTLGPPRLLMTGKSVPDGGAFPIDLDVNAAGVKLTAKGGIASPATFAGLDVAVQASAADLRTLTPLMGRLMPALRDVAFSGRVADGPGGYRQAIVLTAASLTLPQGDLTGDATLTFGARAKLQATLSSRRLDLDALLPVVAAVDPVAPAVAAPTTPVPATGASRRVFSDRPLPFGVLGLADADLSLTLGELRSDGVVYHDIAGHAVVDGGKLTLDPFAGETPSGRVDVTLTVDATQSEPPVAVTLKAPGLAIKPVLAMFGLPDDVTGAIEIDADLHGTGRTPHELASGVDGRLGIAMIDADVENRTLVALVGDVLRAARLPVELGGAGRSRLRCFALRLDATHGTATAGALVLDSTRLLLQGSGSLGLGEEGLALRLRPVLRLGAGPGLAVPVRVGGTLRDPKAVIDVAGTLEATLGAAAGLQGGRGVSPSGIDRSGDLCPPALTAARDGRVGSMPTTPPGGAAAASGSATGKLNPAQLLRGLVR